MNITNMIEQIKYKEEKILNHPFKVGILPNSGQIIPGFPEAILDFDETGFGVYTFDGLVKLVYNKQKFHFLYDDIKEVELGKYNFKDRYMKITFEDDKFVAFAYKLNYKKYPFHQENMTLFFDRIESMSE